MSVIADLFRTAGGGYRDRFADRMLPSHLRVMRDIEQCRTPALGGHLYRCEDCQKIDAAYHSCRNRHCPTCQGDRAEIWAEAQKARILPTDYYLITFTLPASLRALAGSHQHEIYNTLLRCAAQSIQKIAKDPKYIGAVPGTIGILHTWTRDLRYHPHAHFLVTAGGLTAEGLTWRHAKNPNFLMPGRVLSPIFRAKFREALEQASLLGEVPKKAWKQDWVVHLKPTGDGEQMIEYLGRYLFRPPLSNQSIERTEAGKVTFRYRDGKSGQTKHCHVTHAMSSSAASSATSCPEASPGSATTAASVRVPPRSSPWRDRSSRACTEQRRATKPRTRRATPDAATTRSTPKIPRWRRTTASRSPHGVVPSARKPRCDGSQTFLVHCEAGVPTGHRHE